MAARFWVTGGTGNWSSTTNWSATSGGASGASVPGSADTATLNASSGSGTVTLDISPDIQTLTCTGFTGTLAFGTNTISLNSTGTIFTGATTMTVTGTPQIICTNSSATSRTISPTAVTEANSISFRITAGTGNITPGTGSAFRDLDFTDGTNPTGWSGALGSNAITVYGNFKASTGMTQTNSSNAITFAATSGTKTIDTAGVTFDRSFIFNGVGGTFQLQSALTSGSTRTVTLTNGTLDLASYTLTVGLFSSTNSNVRTLAFGTGKIVLTGSSATIFTTGTFTNLTVTGTSLVQCTYSGSVGTRGLTFGTGAISEANAINFEVTAGSDILSLAGTGGAARDVNLTGFSGTIDIPSAKTFYGSLNFGGATAISGTSIVTFAATSGTKTIRSNGLIYGGSFVFNGVGGAWSLLDNLTLSAGATLTAGTLDVNGYTLTATSLSGTGSLVRRLVTNSVPIILTGSGANVVSFGTTGNLTVDVTPTLNLTYSGSVGTRTISFGASLGTYVNAPNINVAAAGDIVTTSGTSTIGSLTFASGFTGTLDNAQRNINGNLTLVSGMSVASGTQVNSFVGTSSQTITTAGQTLDFPITFNGIGGTWSLQDALIVGPTRTILHWAGTLTTNGYAVSCGKFGGSGSVATGDRTLNLGASSFTCFGSATTSASWQVDDGAFSYTVNAGTSTIYLAEPFTGTSEQYFYGGGKTYYNVVFSTTQPGGFYNSSTFNSISNSAQPLTLGFEAGSTQTVSNFAVSGTSGNLVTLQSETPGTQWNLVKATGSKVVVSFCSITDSNATPAIGYWFAPTTQGNVDGGNNTGWNFGSAGNNSSFMLLM